MSTRNDAVIAIQENLQENSACTEWLDEEEGKKNQNLSNGYCVDF